MKLPASKPFFLRSNEETVHPSVSLPPSEEEPNLKAEFTVYVNQTSHTHPLPRNSTLKVGRGSRVHVRVDDASVSREHLVLHVGDDSIEVEELGSSNGTVLYRAQRSKEDSEQPPAPEITLQPGQRYTLAPGDMLRIGSVPALLQREARAATSIRSTIPPPSGGERCIRLDPEMKRLYELAGRAAKSEIGVLIMGETGVGKELLASAVHDQSRRSNYPFFQLNCAALAENLLESELFGHEKGAFTGAHTARAGIFEASRGGTVFLDEIGEMPLSTQAKLLRVLEERRLRRLGSSKSIPIDVRFVVATNRDLAEEVAQKRFRGDLFYRISGITLIVPPLRERPSEIEPLARHFLSEFCVKNCIEVPEITEEAVHKMLEYSWPGNVRELKNAMERAPFLSSGGPIGTEHLPSNEPVPTDDDPFPDEQTDVFVPSARPGTRVPDRETSPLGVPGLPMRPTRPPRPAAGDWHDVSIPGPASGPSAAALNSLGRATSRTSQAPHSSGAPRSSLEPRSSSSHSFRPHSSKPASSRQRSVAPLAHGNSREFCEEEERQRVISALERCGGNQTRAAKLLGVSRRTLINRLDALGIPRPRKQPGK